MTSRGTSRGATLVEVLANTLVFSFVVLATFVISRIATDALRVAEARADVTRQMRNAVADIQGELERASLRTVATWTPASDYRWALWFKTAMNDHDCTLDSPRMKLGPSDHVITQGTDPVMQRYVLYYVSRMAKAEHDAAYGALCDEAYATQTGPDVRCPHKVLVKKEIYLTEDRTPSGADAIGPPAAPLASATVTRLGRFLTGERTLSAWTNEAESGDAPLRGSSGQALVSRVRVLGRNVLSFELARLKPDPAHPTSCPLAASLGPIVLVDLKVFKTAQAAQRVSLGGAMVTTSMTDDFVNVRPNPTCPQEATTAFTVVPTYAPFTVQIDARVVPENP